MGQKILAIIVILAMLLMMGIPPTVIFFFATVVYFVWRAVDRSEQHETRRIFDFYLAANEILRDEERRWYGYEIGEVISQGDAVLHTMKDPPPLVYFALGALHYRVQEYESAIEHLSYVVENESGDERSRYAPSPELRRYVSVLRRLEREPAEGPQTMAAIRSLERSRRARAASMLAESRERLNAMPQIQPAPPSISQRQSPARDQTLRAANSNTSAPQLAAPPTMPPPIAEVLHDLYDEEKKTA
ncbi:MAG: hypothetical protein M3371_14350 [Acidobacteriota bacterium]|nr:hypothetical protein [Acidobacteriota bacterium]